MLVAVAFVLWSALSLLEMATGTHLSPWPAYGNCGDSNPDQLPETVRIGLYEEFPVPWRLDKLAQIDFPVTLTVATQSRMEHLELRDEIMQQYPQVQEVYFRPLLTEDEGYYPGTWSDSAAVQRVAGDAQGLPTLWDLELPLDLRIHSLNDWWQNRDFLDKWLREREEPVHIWRTHTSMGLNPRFLRMIAMHFDPLDYPAVYLHLNLYTTGTGKSDNDLSRILRCGVERYGEQFIPSYGLLNDGEGPADIFIPPETLQRYLQLARDAGVSEIWLFGINGLNDDYLNALKAVIPLEPVGED